MATHDYIISNASGAAVRADLNNALAAIASNNSSATEPTTTYAYQWWADTGSSPTVMKLRNSANSAWVTLFQLDGEWSVIPFENGTAAAPSIYFKDSGTDTGLFSGGTDQVNITTGGTERVEWGTSEVVFNDGGNNYDFRIEGDTNANLFFVDASADKVGIGTTSPSTLLHLASSSVDPTISFSRDPGSGNVNLIKSDFNDLTFTSYRHLLFTSGGTTERARLDSSGRLLVGTSSARTNIREGTDNETPKIQFESATNDYSEAGLSIVNNSSSGFAPQLWLGRSASDSIGGNALVSSGRIGSISFNAADGTNFIQGARIQADIDGTSGSGDLPTRLSFSVTADGASSPTERMRITQAGDIRINQVNAINVERLAINGGAGSYACITCYQNTSAGITQIYFTNSNGNVGSITTTGSATAYNTSSDYRLKENVTAVTDGITRLQQLKPSRFNFIADPDTTVDGFIAHEVQAVVPEAINGEKDAEDEDGNPVYQGIDQSKLVPLLTAALQEAIAKIETLEAKVAALEAN